MFKLRTVVILINVVTNILLLRPFGRIIYDVAQSVADLRLLESKFAIKIISLTKYKVYAKLV